MQLWTMQGGRSDLTNEIATYGMYIIANVIECIDL